MIPDMYSRHSSPAVATTMTLEILFLTFFILNHRLAGVCLGKSIMVTPTYNTMLTETVDRDYRILRPPDAKKSQCVEY